MKFPSWGAKKEKVSADDKPDTKKVSSPKSSKTKALPVKSQDQAAQAKKQIFLGLCFIVAGLIGCIAVFGMTVNAQHVQLTNLRDKVLLVSTEKEVANHKVSVLQEEVGKVLDLERVVEQSKKVHGDVEENRKEGSLWINRKSARFLVSLGVLNGVKKDTRLSVYDGNKKFATLKVISVLDVVSYAEPVDKKLPEFLKDYYSVKLE